MNICQTESCFVCNRDVDDKGVSLRMEMTSYSRTAFPNKLMELLGESFMLVILEDDKICCRCSKLINRTDKLEQDLRQLKSIIMGFLNEKYDLNRKEEEPSSTIEEPQDPKDKDICDKQHLMHSPTIKVKHIDDESYQHIDHFKDIEEICQLNGISENPCDVGIKPESVNCDQNLNNSSCNTSENCNRSISGALLQEFPQQDLIEKDSTLESSQSEINQTFQELVDEAVITEVKMEKCLADNGLNSTKISLPFINNNLSIKSDLSFSVLKHEHSNMDENMSNMKFCENSISVNIQDNLSPEIVPCIESSKTITGQVTEVELLNIADNNESRRRSKRQLSKRIKKEITTTTVKKLRPILPKISNLKESPPSLSIVQNSNFSVNGEVLNNHPKCNESTTFLSSDSETLKKIRSLNSEIKEISNQSNSEVALTVRSIADIPSAENSNTYCKICNMNFTGPYKIHIKKHQQNDKIFICSFCLKIFKRKVDVEKHEAEHLGNYLHCCEFCGKGFNKMDKLEDHRRMHTKEERFVCDVCGKKFHFHATYWIHRKWHDNPFPYKCNDCGKPFKHSSQLSIHRRREHTHERPYKCTYCSQTFNVSNTLKRHLVLHTKQYPYVCIVCSQGFTARFKYVEHLERKHNLTVEKPPAIDPKDYKMVINDNAGENIETDPLGTVNTMDCDESNCNFENVENPDFFFNTNPSDYEIQIVVPSPSMFSDMNLPDFTWLT